jgi:hypothetical protein
MESQRLVGRVKRRMTEFVVLARPASLGRPCSSAARKAGFVASITDEFSPVHGLEAATLLAARPVPAVVPPMPQRKGDIERGCGLLRAGVKRR